MVSGKNKKQKTIELKGTGILLSKIGFQDRLKENLFLLK